MRSAWSSTRVRAGLGAAALAAVVGVVLVVDAAREDTSGDVVAPVAAPAAPAEGADTVPSEDVAAEEVAG